MLNWKRENVGINRGYSQGNGWILRNSTRNYQNTSRNMSFYPKTVFPRKLQGWNVAVDRDSIVMNDVDETK